MSPNQFSAEKKRFIKDVFCRNCELLISLLAELPVCIGYVDKQQHYRFNNACYAQWFNLSLDEISNRHIRDVLGQNQYRRQQSKIETALRGKPVQFVSTLSAADYRSRTFQVNYIPDLDQQGQCQGFIILALDISQQYQDKESISRYEEPGNRICEEVAVGTMLLEVVSGDGNHPYEYRYTEVNTAFGQLTGIRTVQAPGKTLAQIFPDAESFWYEKIDRVYETGKSETFEKYVLSLERHYEVTISRPEKKIIGVSFADVTNKKIIAKQLPKDMLPANTFQRQLFFPEAVFLHTSEGICITNAEGKIEQVNPAFTCLTGYSAAEVIGHNPRILKSGHQPPAFYKDLWKQLSEKGTWSGEIWNRKKSGEIYPEFLSISAVTGQYGEVLHYVAVFHDISELVRNREELSPQANNDTLTGLPSRATFLERLQMFISNADQYGGVLVAALIDLDDFKDVNETHGHQNGDLVLREASSRIRSCLRSQDLVARMGGDEFALLLPDVSVEGEEALVIATRLMQELARPYNLGDESIRLHASIGVSLYPDLADSEVTLLQQTEIALRTAKGLGKSRVTFYSDKVCRSLQRSLTLQKNLYRGLQANEFLLYYQPKIRLADGRITGVEALIRWRPFTGNLVGPDEFIPLAERTGFIIELGDWIIEEACRQLARWHKSGLDDFTVAINLSARQFTDPQLVDKLQRALHKHGLEVGHLHLEITEHTMVEHIETTVQVMERLAENGFVLSIDDFGTGFSSLSYLRRFPIHLLKIDRTFVEKVPQDSHDVTIIQLIQNLADAMDFKVIAEGVETREQYDFVRRLGAYEMQGYLCSRPLPAEALELFVHKHEFWSLEESVSSWQCLPETEVGH